MLIVFYPFYVKGLPFFTALVRYGAGSLASWLARSLALAASTFFQLSFNVDPFKILICFICFPL